MGRYISRDPLTFVLIPGAGIDPGAWRWTIQELQARGHRGLAPRLPLEDPGAGPSAHAGAVVEAVRQLSGPLVVVGQSLGAFAASLVAARMEVVELVLLAPMIPAPGETAGDWWGAVKHDEAIAPLVQRLGAMTTWGPAELAEVFLHDVPSGIAAAAARFVGAPGAGMFGEPWPLSAWPEVPTRVLAPREDRLFPIAFQRRVARERLGLPVEEMPGGHVPMLARPSELVDRLVAGTRSAGRAHGDSRIRGSTIAELR
ncbi:MAG: alpha/beta hydrolase [Solirubrobacterales bacterium]|nr:alpha/beta hydrolase [Solirubrobacterales bacterium]